MARSSHSPIRDLNAAIEASNPFRCPATVQDKDIWGFGFPDLADLNAHTSAPVLAAIEQAQTGQPTVSSFAITAESGAGKSHLVSRIRQQIRAQGNAFLVYVNAQRLSELGSIRYQFLQTWIDSFRYSGCQGQMQWQELAAMMANQAIQTLKPNSKPFAPRELVKKLDDSHLNTNKTWIGQLTDAFLKLNPTLRDPDIIRAIFWTLSSSQAAFAIKWLGGRTLASWKVDELGLPPRQREDRESDALETLLQVVTLACQYRALVICFDQLETSEVSENNNFKRERVVASLVKYLFDQFNLLDLQRGAVFLTAMQPETWSESIQDLPSGIPERVVGKGQEPMALESPLTEDRIVDLVKFRLRAFYATRRLRPPNPVYPFDLLQLRALGRENLTARDILEWCEENFKPVEIDPLEQVERTFQEASSQSLDAVWEDDRFLANVLHFCLATLTGRTVEGVALTAINASVEPQQLNRGYLQFQWQGQAADALVKVGVAVVQSTQPVAIQAALKRLVQPETFGLTGGCLIRDRSWERCIPPHWRCNLSLEQFLAAGGKWVELKEEEFRPLLALYSIHQNCQDLNLDEAHVLEFIAQRQLIANNPLIRAILSCDREPPFTDGEADTVTDNPLNSLLNDCLVDDSCSPVN